MQNLMIIHKMVPLHVIILVIVVNVAWGTYSSYERDQRWRQWKSKYHKVYSDIEEDTLRRSIWEENLFEIEQHNNQQPAPSFTMAMNKFGDMLFESKPYVVKPEVKRINSTVGIPPDIKVPLNFDWREHGVITHVADVWPNGIRPSFVAAECVESLNKILGGQLYNLSTDEVSDCCGGTYYYLFDCVRDMGGLCTNETYKWNYLNCNNKTCAPVAKVPHGTKKIKVGNETDLLLSLLNTPIYVSVDVFGQKSFMFYEKGVYDNPRCGNDTLDHVMQLVGYGTPPDSTHYWIVRNNFGKDWGMNGYIYMARFKNNQCGIASDASYPY